MNKKSGFVAARMVAGINTFPYLGESHYFHKAMRDKPSDYIDESRDRGDLPGSGKCGIRSGISGHFIS